MPLTPTPDLEYMSATLRTIQDGLDLRDREAHDPYSDFLSAYLKVAVDALIRWEVGWETWSPAMIHIHQPKIAIHDLWLCEDAIWDETNSDISFVEVCHYFDTDPDLVRAKIYEKVRPESLDRLRQYDTQNIHWRNSFLLHWGREEFGCGIDGLSPDLADRTGGGGEGGGGGGETLRTS